jgi:predicted small lipoprotein YifL
MRTVVISLVSAAVLAACGYRGPLYLPKPKPEAQAPAPVATQDPKKDAAPSP